MPDDPIPELKLNVDFPLRCPLCHVELMGGATKHKKDCPFYPISYQALLDGIDPPKIEPEE